MVAPFLLELMMVSCIVVAEDGEYWLRSPSLFVTIAIERFIAKGWR